MLVKESQRAIVMETTMLVAEDVWPEIAGKNVQRTTRRPQYIYFEEYIVFVCTMKEKEIF